MAADSPTRRRAALRPGMESSLGCSLDVFCALHFLVVVGTHHIGSATRCQACYLRRLRAAAPTSREDCTSGLGSELRLDEGRDKTRHCRIEIIRAAHEMDGG